MADRVSTSIIIGGPITAALLPDFIAVVAGEGLSTEWDGPSFTEQDLPTDEPVSLMAHEVAWGRFEELEAFCQANALPFERWSAGEEDRILLDRATIDRLGTVEAIRDHFAAADFTVPAFRVIPNEAGVPESGER